MLHSLRHHEKSRTIDRLLWSLAAGICAWILAVSFANAEEPRPRFLLTTSQIVTAMQNRDLPTRGVQVRLPAPITAAVANPALEIQTVALVNPREIRLRLACRNRSECLSFFVIATYPDALAPASLKMNADHQAAVTDQPVSSAKIAAEVPPTRAISGKTTASGEPPVLRSGTPATLGFDGERVHVRVEVICLQSGATGDKIRVTTRDHKQVYVAEIVAPTLLKGTLTQ